MAKRYITLGKVRENLHDALSEILENPKSRITAEDRRRGIKATDLSQDWEVQKPVEKETLRDILAIVQNHNCEMPGAFADIRAICIAELGEG